jgi:hypothetical protein
MTKKGKTSISSVPVLCIASEHPFFSLKQPKPPTAIGTVRVLGILRHILIPKIIKKIMLWVKMSNIMAV